MGEEADHASSPEEPLQTYADLILSLPRRIYCGIYPVRQYRGFWFPESFLHATLALRDNFRPRPDDLFLVTYPKSGTTWAKALMFAAMTRNQHPLAQHPLLTRNPHDYVPYMDEIFVVDHAASKIDAMPSPRIMATHTPYSVLPDAITSAPSPSCRIVYVCRDPKDVLVSFSNFPINGVQLSLPERFEPFCEGVCAYGPTWQHVLEFWKESRRRPDKILFLKYDDMLEDPVGSLRKLAEFMGCPFSADEEKEGVPADIASLCSFKKLKELEVNKKGEQGTVLKVSNAAFFRKGEAGDWKNHLSQEMADKIDQIFQSKLQGSGLALGASASP